MNRWALQEETLTQKPNLTTIRRMCQSQKSIFWAIEQFSMFFFLTIMVYLQVDKDLAFLRGCTLINDQYLNIAVTTLPLTVLYQIIFPFCSLLA